MIGDTVFPGVELAEIGLPDFGLPAAEPSVPAATYAARLEATRAAADDDGLDALLVYADREHFANLSYLTRSRPGGSRPPPTWSRNCARSAATR